MKKQRWEESEKRRRKKIREEKQPKKKDAGAQKGRKVANHSVFPMICGSGGSKSRLAKAAGAEPSGRMRDEQLHAIVVRSTCRSQNVGSTFRSTFRNWDVEKVHAVVARSTFQSQECEKINGFGPLLEVVMLKKCMALWREAHFEVKSVKNWQVWTTFGSRDVEKVHAVVARSTFQSQKCSILEVRMMWFCLAEMLGVQGADFRRGVACWNILEHPIFRFAC